MSLAASADHPAAATGPVLRYRARRLRAFVALVDAVLAEKGSAHVLDMGGTAQYWRDLEPVWRGRPIAFTLVNLDEDRADPRFRVERGDCRDLARFPDGAFDIVHSNSVVEHVGRWADMKAFAREVRRLAPRYFVQTPSYWFPLEPHNRVPFFHWLPEPARTAILMRRACGAFPKARDLDEAQRFLEDSILLDAARMRALFPEARLERERVFGLTKSYMAIR